MNDKFNAHLESANVRNENELLADFCGKYGFDEAGTRQSTPQKKKNYQFSFQSEEKKEFSKKITCDPHMKMSSCDSNCKHPPANFNGRIYFHYGDDEIAKGKILVGSIGPHL